MSAFARGCGAVAVTSIVCLTLVAGCDWPTATVENSRVSPGDVSMMSIPALPPKISGVEVSQRGEPFPDDAELTTAVAEAEGRISIGLKNPGDEHSWEIGRTADLSRSAVLGFRDELRSAGVAITRTFRSGASLYARIEPELAPTVRNLPFVDYIVPQIVFRLASQQDSSWGIYMIQADQAWEYESYVAGDRATITILDGGVDFRHRTEWGGDIYYGVDHCRYTTLFTSCDDAGYHGSHVLGIAAGQDNPFGYIGVAWDAASPTSSSVNVVKVCDGDGYCRERDVAGGLDWTATNGYARQVVNMSLGNDSETPTIEEYANRSYQAGNLLVASAGNNEGELVEYPAGYDNVIAVAGVDPDGSPSDGIRWVFPNHSPSYQIFSNWGPEVELSAPFCAWSMIDDRRWDYHCGTSMAAPHVTGVAAMTWSVHTGWSRDQVRAHLQNTADDLGASGRDPYYGYGRVNADRAVALQVTINGPGAIYEPTNSWTASTSGGGGCCYTYQWAVKFDAKGYWEDLGSSATQELTVARSDGNFTLRVTVTSGQRQEVRQLYVANYVECTTRNC